MIQVAIGDRLGPYEILAPLGMDGMDEAYKARDTRLRREVAIEVSKLQFSNQFEREARLITSLNPPHVCTLHDIGPNYGVVMELLEGVPPNGLIMAGRYPHHPGVFSDLCNLASRPTQTFALLSAVSSVPVSNSRSKDGLMASDGNWDCLYQKAPVQRALCSA